MDKPTLFAYDNYRAYLGDWFAWAKSEKRGYSYRVFARQAGFKAPNQLLLVINGERNIALPTLMRYFKVLGFTPVEQKYFELLVKFNQARTMADKAEYFRELSGYWLKKGSLLQRGQSQYLTRWYYAAIREMVTLKNFHANGEWIAKKLQHRIRSKQANEAIQELLKLGLLHKQADGKLVQTSQYVSTGNEAQAVAAYLYHTQMMALALDSLNDKPCSERNMTALTFTIKKRDYEHIVSEIHEFRKRIIAFLQSRTSQENDDALYQLNIHLFPITEVEA